MFKINIKSIQLFTKKIHLIDWFFEKKNCVVRQNVNFRQTKGDQRDIVFELYCKTRKRYNKNSHNFFDTSDTYYHKTLKL